MKNLFTSFFLFAFAGSILAQQAGILDASAGREKFPFNYTSKFEKRHAKGGLRAAKRDTFVLSHASFNRGVVDQSSGELTQYYFPWYGRLNTNLPNDSSLTMRWINIVYDKLSMGFTSNGTTIPFNANLSKSKMYLDSLDVLYAYTKPNLARPDTLVITYWNRNLQPGNMKNFDAVSPILPAAILKRDTVIFTTVPTKDPNIYSALGGGATLTRPIGIQLDTAVTFGVLFQFYGDINSMFMIPPSYAIKKSCDNNGSAINSYYESTNYYLNYRNTTTGDKSLSGVYTNHQSLVFPAYPDCNRMYFQVYPVYVTVIDSVKFSCEVVPNQHPLSFSSTKIGESDKVCNGNNIDLRLCVAGNSSNNLTFNWTNTQGSIDDKTIGTPIYTQSNLNSKVSVTVIDGSDSTTCSADIYSKGIKATVSGDTSLPCTLLGSIQANAVGTTGGLKYAWSGALSTQTSKIVSNVDVGAYTVTITNAFDCSATNSFKVQNPGVTINLDFDNKISQCTDQFRVVPNTSNEKAGYKFMWYIGSTLSDSSENGMLKFPTAGVNQLTLMATNTTTGCKALPITKSITAKKCAGITTFGNNTSLNIYPNPSNDQININISNLEHDGEITVSNMVGEVVERRLVKASSSINEMVSLARFAEGIYFVKLASGNESTTQKIILEK